MRIAYGVKSAHFPFHSQSPSKHLENQVWRFARGFHVNLRPVPHKGNFGEKWHYFTGTAWFECLKLRRKKLKMVKSKKMRCLQVDNVQNQKHAEPVLVSNKFSAHTSCPFQFQFIKHFKEKNCHFAWGFNHLFRTSAFLLPDAVLKNCSSTYPLHVSSRTRVTTNRK